MQYQIELCYSYIYYNIFITRFSKSYTNYVQTHISPQPLHPNNEKFWMREWLWVNVNNATGLAYHSNVKLNNKWCFNKVNI